MKTSHLTLPLLLVLAILAHQCGPGIVTEPAPPAGEPEAPEPPGVAELREPVSPYPHMGQVITLVEKLGRKIKSAIGYREFQNLTRGAENPAIDPEWFQDSYRLPVNEKGLWFFIHLNTAKKAMSRDTRIEALMSDLPEVSLNITLKRGDGTQYILTDYQGDGILDFAKPTTDQSANLDIELLDRMQKEYTWLLDHLWKIASHR